MEKDAVAIVNTSPETVVQDYHRLMQLSGAFEHLPKDEEILLKLNLSWTLYYPASSTQPWQLDGVIRALLEEGYSAKKLIAVENRTVVTDVKKGADRNLWTGIFRHYGIRFIPLPDTEWISYNPRSPLRVLPKLFPRGLEIPEIFLGKWVVHLPTIKTHGHAITTGAVKNSFGGLLKEYRHYGHKWIHETLLDLMWLQKEIHPGIWAVMDGTIAGDGAGPRTMVPKVKNILLASGDSVAVDSIAAKLMGFDPLNIPYLIMCEQDGLGVANPEKIPLVGDTHRANESWGFISKRSPVIWGDQAIRKGFLRPLEKILLYSPLWVWAPFASYVYHDLFWYPLVGKKYFNQFYQTAWGQLWRKYAEKQKKQKWVYSTTRI